MNSFIDQLLKVLPTVFTALAVLGVWYWNYVRERKAEFADRASLAVWRPRLTDSPRLVRYRDIIEHALDRVDGFFGEKPFGWRALSTCWLIAYVYPLVLFILTWVAGGPHTLGGLDLLPEGWNPIRRWGFVASFVACGCGLFLLVRHAEEVDIWVDERVDRLLVRLLRRLPELWRRAVGALILGLLVGALVYAFTGSLSLAFGVSISSAGALILLFTENFSLGITILVALGLVFTAALVEALIVTITILFVGVFLGGYAILFARSVPVLSASAAFFAVGAATFIVVGSVFFYIGGGWAPIFDPDVVSLLVFLLILPLLNGLLDYVSWGVSRRLGRALLAHFGQYTAIALAFVDLVCAVLLLGTLAVMLCTTVEALNALALAKTGAGALDLDGLLVEAAAQPLGSGFWITAMLFSTLIPTAFHLGITATSAFLVRSRSKERGVWVEKIDYILATEDAHPLSEIERGRIARYLFFHRAPGPLVLTLALVGLFVWGWSAIVGDISDTLLALADWSRGLVHGG